MRLFGLVGYPLSHSFSEIYFNVKFQREQIPDVSYRLFEIRQLSEIQSLLRRYPELCGLNVTIPYKTAILDFAGEISTEAAAIGASNCIKINRTGSSFSLSAYNTDAAAFEHSIRPLLNPSYTHVLILGTGGASKAVAFALNHIEQIKNVTVVSRNPLSRQLSYHDLKQPEVFSRFQVIVNATPAGMFPHLSSCPDIPYPLLRPGMLIYDLIYNPAESLFLQKAKQAGCIVKNGMEMLILQAEMSWSIWNR